MNQRYERMNELLKEWKKTGKQDKNILKALFAQVNLENAPQVKPDDKLITQTMYTDLSDEQLYEMYEKRVFNNLSTKELQNLIQESHNRFMKSNNLDVTRYVVVESDKEKDGVYGFVCSEDNMLFINKYMIDKAKQISINRDNFNADNLGKCMLFTTAHESKHVVQFDNSVRFALNEKMSKDEMFSGAMTGLNNANFFIADEKGDETYFMQWEAMYNYHFLEHEANYTATTNVENMISEENKGDMAYHQYLAETSLLGLRYMPSLTESNHGKIKTRVQKIENYIKKQVAYFEENAENCPLKNQMLKVINDYIKVDEKGHSELRTRLYREIQEMNDNCVNSIKTVKDMRKGKTRKLIDNEDLDFTLDESKRL
ncbi:MAG: hypothetical protein IJW82_08055 [Clostridia bacterium]|nr:hypothetical protein [Clostridia bacterium]